MAQGGWNLQTSCDTAYPQMSKCCMIPLTGAGVRESLKGNCLVEVGFPFGEVHLCWNWGEGI